MDPDRVDADLRDTPADPVYMASQGLHEGTASAPRVSPGVVDVGRCERTGAVARLSACASPSAVACASEDDGEGRGLDKAPPALSHDGNGQEAALTRLR